MTSNEATAKKFIERNINYIENEDWESFFDAQWDAEHINTQTSWLILDYLNKCDIKWDESARVKILFQGINSVLENCFSGGEKVMLEALYFFDEDQWIDGASGWLGYDQEEFYDLIKANPEQIKCGVLNDDTIFLYY